MKKPPLECTEFELVETDLKQAIKDKESILSSPYPKDSTEMEKRLTKLSVVDFRITMLTEQLSKLTK
jgi:hypothetical protein